MSSKKKYKKNTIKTSLFDMFLKYQFIICVEPKIPTSHLVVITLFTCIFHSLYCLMLYWVSIIFIITIFYLSEKYPNTIGAYYISFLKKHSSQEVFNKYCGNPLEIIKASLGFMKTGIQNPEIVKTVSKNGAGKLISGSVAALGVEHTIHKIKLGQIYEY